MRNGVGETTTVRILFVYLFGGAIRTGTAYHNYVLPGVIVLCAGFGSSLTAVAVCADMTGGIIDRFRSMDISGAAVLAGHVAASLVRNAILAARLRAPPAGHPGDRVAHGDAGRHEPVAGAGVVRRPTGGVGRADRSALPAARAVNNRRGLLGTITS
jgi:hypothetical protein